jgi:hypothetical protein
MRSPSYHNFRRDVQRSFGAVRGTVDWLLWRPSPFTVMRQSCSLKIGTTDPRGACHRGVEVPRHNLVFGRSVCGSHHDAVIRIVGEAPGRRAQSAQRHLKPWFLRRDTATSDLSAALGMGLLNRLSYRYSSSTLSFMTLDVTRRPAEPRPLSRDARGR